MTWILGIVLGLLLLATMGGPAPTTSPTATTADSNWWCKPLLPDDGQSRGRIVAVPVTTPDEHC